MKKKILSLTLVIIMLMNFVVFMPKAKAASFSDVPDAYWANYYISSIQGLNIINGYEDNTFKPENEVKTGEFIKMITLCRWTPDLSKELPEGAHWVTPYAKLANKFIIYEPEYTYEDYESYITRADAVEMLWKMYAIMHKEIVPDRTEKYIKTYSDESIIKDKQLRYYFNACIEFGLINGFDDGTLKPNETLTRAQAAKLIYLCVS